MTLEPVEWPDNEDDGPDEDGPFRDDLRSQLVAAGTAAAEQWLTVRTNRRMSVVNRRRLAGHIVNALWAEIERAALEMAQYGGDERVAAATERAETAEAELVEARATASAYLATLGRFADEDEDSLRAERDEARARLAELSLLRLEWSTANSYSDLGDDIVSEQLARRRVASRPEIHATVVSRQIYAGPWREGACRSCGTDEHVAGDPPLCSSCAVYSAGWSSQRPDASLDGLRGPFTGLLGPLGIAPDVREDNDA